MLGRAVYHRPVLLAELEQALIDPQLAVPGAQEIVEACGCLREGLRAPGHTPAFDHPAHAWIDGRTRGRARLAAVPIGGGGTALSGAWTLYSALPILNPGYRRVKD